MLTMAEFSNNLYLFGLFFIPLMREIVGLYFTHTVLWAFVAVALFGIGVALTCWVLRDFIKSVAHSVSGAARTMEEIEDENLSFYLKYVAQQNKDDFDVSELDPYNLPVDAKPDRVPDEFVGYGDDDWYYPAPDGRRDHRRRH